MSLRKKGVLFANNTPACGLFDDVPKTSAAVQLQRKPCLRFNGGGMSCILSSVREADMCVACVEARVHWQTMYFN